MASRVGVMYLGPLVEIAEDSELFARPRMPYTQVLLGAVPGSRNVGPASVFQ